MVSYLWSHMKASFARLIQSPATRHATACKEDKMSTRKSRALRLDLLGPHDLLGVHAQAPGKLVAFLVCDGS